MSKQTGSFDLNSCSEDLESWPFWGVRVIGQLTLILSLIDTIISKNAKNLRRQTSPVAIWQLWQHISFARTVENELRKCFINSQG